MGGGCPRLVDGPRPGAKIVELAVTGFGFQGDLKIFASFLIHRDAFPEPFAFLGTGWGGRVPILSFCRKRSRSSLRSVSDFEFRFGGLSRLYGAAGLDRLRRAHVAVIGIGGVGSWVVEALARSGVGALTLIDLDEVCVSNVNRQLPALEGSLGRAKAEVMAERYRAIQPEGKVQAILEFFTESSADSLLDAFQAAGGSWVVDAIDASANKCRIIQGCRRRGLPVLVCGAAGGRLDPTQIKVADLAQVTHDRLLSDVRKRLRRDPEFTGSGKNWGIPAVFSPETPVVQQADGQVCEVTEAVLEPGETPRLNCQQGFGSAAFVTGGFGLAAAGYVVRRIARVDGLIPTPAVSNLQTSATLAQDGGAILET